MELTLHPLCTYFPRIGGAGFNELKADIQAHGLLHPIVLYEGQILDGGNRYRACVEAGIEPEVVEYDGDDPAAFVCSSNVHRRNMSLGQRAIAVANAANWAKAQRAGRPKVAADATLQTIADRAAESGASKRTQRNADKVARSDPALAQAVTRGEISLPEALQKVNGHQRKPKPKVSEQPPAAIHGDIEVSAADGAPDFDALLISLQATIKVQEVQIRALSDSDRGGELLKQIEIRRDAERELGIKMNAVARRDRELKSWSSWYAKAAKLTGCDKRSDLLQWIQERV